MTETNTPCNERLELLHQINERKRQAQEQIAKIEQQVHELEEQSRILEELHQKEQELVSKRKDLRSKLTRAVALLQREEEAIKLDAEQIAKVRTIFEDTLQEIQKINPENWDPQRYEEQLTQALSFLDYARKTYDENRSKICLLREEDNNYNFHQEVNDQEELNIRGGDDFFYWFKRGLAYNLPLIILGVVIAILLALLIE